MTLKIPGRENYFGYERSTGGCQGSLVHRSDESVGFLGNASALRCRRHSPAPTGDCRLPWHPAGSTTRFPPAMGSPCGKDKAIAKDPCLRQPPGCLWNHGGGPAYNIHLSSCNLQLFYSLDTSYPDLSCYLCCSYKNKGYDSMETSSTSVPSAFTWPSLARMAIACFSSSCAALTSSELLAESCSKYSCARLRFPPPCK